jgi:hypothetical protein
MCAARRRPLVSAALAMLAVRRCRLPTHVPRNLELAPKSAVRDTCRTRAAAQRPGNQVGGPSAAVLSFGPGTTGSRWARPDTVQAVSEACWPSYRSFGSGAQLRVHLRHQGCPAPILARTAVGLHAAVPHNGSIQIIAVSPSISSRSASQWAVAAHSGAPPTASTSPAMNSQCVVIAVASAPPH